MPSHEAEVAKFMREAKEKDPGRYADVCKRNPVLSDDTLKKRRKRLGVTEIPLEVLE